MIRRAFLLALLATTAEAATYYVDPVNGTGSSPTAGCGSGAYATVAAMIAAGRPAINDTARLCTGNYRESWTIANDSTTWENAPGHTPVLMGTTPCSSWTLDGGTTGVYRCPYAQPAGTATAASGYGIAKLFVGSTPTNGEPIAEAQAQGCPSPLSNLETTVGYCATFPAKACTSAADCNQLDAPFGGACVNAGWCWDGTNIHLHKSGGGSPAGDVVEVGSRSLIINANGRAGIVIRGLTFFGAEGQSSTADREYAIRAGSTPGPFTLQDSTFRYGGMSLFVSYAAGMAGKTALVAGNVMDDPGQGWSWPSTVFTTSRLHLVRIQGAEVAGAITRVVGNTVRRMGSHNWARGHGPDCGVSAGANRAKCLWFMFSMQAMSGTVDVDDNLAEDIESNIDIKVDSGDLLGGVRRNDLKGWDHPSTHNAFDSSDTGVGIFCEGAATGGAQNCTANPNAIFRQYEIVGNKIRGGFRGGIGVSAAKKGAGDAYSVLIANNDIKAGDRSFNNNQDAAIIVWVGSANIEIDNNTVQCETPSSNGGSGLCIGASSAGCTSVAGTTGGPIVLTNNVWDIQSCNQKMNVGAGSVTSFNVPTNICETAIAGRCQAAAPWVSYVDAASFDHCPTLSDTAARDQGATLSGFTDDINGTTRPIGAAWDIGACEGAATATTTSASSTTSSATTSTATSSTTTTTLAGGAVDCGNVYPVGGGFSSFWSTNFSGIPCDTGTNANGYTVSAVHVRTGPTVGSPATVKVAVYEAVNAGLPASAPTAAPKCQTAVATVTANTDNVVAISGCGTLLPSTRYYLIFITGNVALELGDTLPNPPGPAAQDAGRYTSLPPDSFTIADAFPDANTVGWSDDGMHETLWLRLAPVGGTTTTTSPTTTTSTTAGGTQSQGGGSAGGGRF